MLGLSIYNGIILDLHFPNALYKKLLEVPLTIEDLAQIQPQIARSMVMMMEMGQCQPDDDEKKKKKNCKDNKEGKKKEKEDSYSSTATEDEDEDEVEALCLTFSTVRRVYGEQREIDLVPNGRNITVTSKNREAYVRAYIDWFFNDSVREIFKEFFIGFHTVVGDLIRMFQPEELEVLIVGSRTLDFAELQSHTVYDGGYDSNHRAIKNFWDIVLHSFTDDERRRLLYFVTSCDRAPIGGLGRMKFIIAKNGGDSEQLPTSHTCFNVLMLPQYATKEKMRKKLLSAIRNTEGFGLK